MLGSVMLFDLHDTVALYRNPFSVWFPTPLMDDLGIDRPPLWTVVVVALATAIAFWSAAVGWFTRTSLALATVGFLAFHSVMRGFSKASPDTNWTEHQVGLVPLLLVTLLLIPSVDSWSIDRRGQQRSGDAVWISAWPVRLLRFVLGAAYLGSAVSKLREDLGWGDGETQRAQLLRASMRYDIDLSRMLAESELVGTIAGAGTIVFEVGFVFAAVLIPIRSRWRVPLVVVGIGFHVATTVLMNIWHFLPYWAPAYLVFLTWEDVQAWRGRHLRTPRGGTTPLDTRARLAVVTMTALLLVPTAVAAEYWPISDFGAFSRRSALEASGADRLVLVADDGSERFLVTGDLGEPFGRRASAANIRRWWLAETGTNRSLTHPDTDPELLDELLGSYWRNLDEDLRAAYPTLEVVRLEVDADALPDEIVVVSRVAHTVTPEG